MNDAIDHIDRKLLHALDYGATEPLVDLARAANVSKQTARYRIDRLEERGIITGYTTLVDMHALGLYTYRAYLRLLPSRIEPVLGQLNKDPRVFWIASYAETWDVEAVFLAPNYIEFHNAWQELSARFADAILDVDLSMSIANHHYARDYLIGEERTPGQPAGYGGTGNESVDDFDTQLLRLLSENCRRSSVELGRHLDVSYHTVSRHIADLEGRGIIQAHKTRIEPEAIGRKYYKACVKLHPGKGQVREAIIENLSNVPDIVYLVETLGSWQLEVDAEVESEDTFLAVMHELRETFSEAVDTYFIIRQTGEHKLDYTSVLTGHA